MLWDQHMHCCYSGDSEAAPEDMIAAAYKRGLSGITFTDHLDLDCAIEPELFSLDIVPRAEYLARLAIEWEGRLTVGCGIELGLQPHLAARHRALLSSHDFDLVIGSTHTVAGIDPYYPVFFEGKTEDEAYLGYFEATLENVKAFLWSIYGVDSMCRKFCPRIFIHSLETAPLQKLLLLRLAKPFPGTQL